ncbi:MAG: hypothetical protein H7Y18_15210 [Clostridiaceae bacterium]|nr:hypothetical protein [Clostridiaceae bacterium]
MSKIKKNVIALVFCSVLILSFFTSYFLSVSNSSKENKTEKVIKSQPKATDNNIVIANTPKEDIVTKDTKITFQVQYKKSDEILPEKKEIDLSTIIGKTKKELEGIYGIQGYIISEMDSNHVNFIKPFNRYSPEKYVLDIFKEGDCIAIFKTDNEGKEKIEDPDNDIKFETKISDVKEGDIDTFLQGSKSLQFDTKQEAIENYMVLFKS